MTEDLNPILVKVKDGHWDAYSVHPQPSERDNMLLQMIRDAGGINEAAKEGVYAFNVMDGGGHILWFIRPLEMPS